MVDYLSMASGPDLDWEVAEAMGLVTYGPGNQSGYYRGQLAMARKLDDYGGRTSVVDRYGVTWRQGTSGVWYSNALPAYSTDPSLYGVLVDDYRLAVIPLMDERWAVAVREHDYHVDLYYRLPLHPNRRGPYVIGSTLGEAVAKMVIHILKEGRRVAP